MRLSADRLYLVAQSSGATMLARLGDLHSNAVVLMLPIPKSYEEHGMPDASSHAGDMLFAFV